MSGTGLEGSQPRESGTGKVRETRVQTRGRSQGLKSRQVRRQRSTEDQDIGRYPV